MRRLLMTAAFALLAGQAQAEWEMIDVSNEDGPAFKGWTADASGQMQAQLYCDDWFPGMVDLTIYTAEIFDPDAGYADEGVLTVTVDGKTSIQTTGYFDKYEDELLIYTSNFDVDNFVDVMVAMTQARKTVTFEFYGRQMTFPAKGLMNTVLELSDNCPTE